LEASPAQFGAVTAGLRRADRCDFKAAEVFCIIA